MELSHQMLLIADFLRKLFFEHYLMATIKLKFRPSSVPETKGTLYYQVIHKRKVKWISTGYHAYPYEWDEKVGEVLILPNSERKAELEKM